MLYGARILGSFQPVMKSSKTLCRLESEFISGILFQLSTSPVSSCSPISYLKVQDIVIDPVRQHNIAWIQALCNKYTEWAISDGAAVPSWLNR